MQFAYTETPLQQKLSKWSVYPATVVISIALIVLIGWMLDIEILKRPIAQTAMNPLSAVAFIFAGLAFVLVSSTKNTATVAGIVCAAIVLCIGLIRCIDVFWVLDTPIDTLLFYSKVQADRMPPNAAVNFLLTGLALLLQRGDTPFYQLLEDYGPQLGEQGARMLGMVSENVKKMTTLIDMLLDFSRLGRKKLDMHSVDMTSIVRSVLAEQPAHHAAIELQELEPAYCDNNLIRQVWANFISNAIKYSSQVEKPVITISSHKTTDEIIYLIQDNGIGFDMQYADKLFGVFERLHHQSEFEGTGVGLALVQRIINKHGGRVWAEAEVHKGAAFYFSLPIAK